MSESVLPTHESLLKLCAAAAPRPWYPKDYAKTSGVPRDSLDAPLNDLRIAGLVKLTEWTKDLGQGYVLTETGEQVVNNPVHLAQIRAGLQPPLVPPRVDEAAEETEPAAPPTPYERGEAARIALYEPEPPRVMPILLLINLIAFGVSVFIALRANVPFGQFLYRGHDGVLRELGALAPNELIRGEWWRLVTCAFLHYGLLHLLVNMLSLWMLGQYESLWGTPRFLIIYFMSALGGSCAAMIWNPNVIMAGASGAIWGLMTSLAVWVFINRSHIKSDRLAERIPNFGVLFVLNVGISFLPGISAAGHFGGGLVGLVVASLLQVQRYAVGPKRTAATVLIALMPFICFAAVAEVIERDPRWQHIKSVEKDRVDREALERFRKDVVQTIDAADAASETVRASAPILLNKAPNNRTREATDKLRKELDDGLKAIKKATDQIGDKAPDDERLKQARTAALEYLSAAKGLIEHVDALLGGKDGIWTAESGQIDKMVGDRRAAWRAARDKLH